MPINFSCIQKYGFMLRLRLNTLNFNPTNKEFTKFEDIKITVLLKFLFCCSNHMDNPRKGLLSEVNMCRQLSVMPTRDLRCSCKLVFHMPHCISVKVVRRFPYGITTKSVFSCPWMGIAHMLCSPLVRTASNRKGSYVTSQ